MRTDGEKEVEGSLTVFFSMLFPVILLLLLVLLQLGKTRLLKAGMLQDQQLAAKSVEGMYVRQFAEKYGLYVLSRKYLREDYLYFFSKNTYHPYGSYEVTSLSVEPVDTLADPAVLEGEIVHWMEERGLMDSAQEVLSLFSELEEKESVKEEYARYRHAQQLYLIQLDYAQLITDIYGIREDGGRNERSVLTFLKNDLKYPGVLQAAENCLKILQLPEEERDAEALYDNLLILEQARSEIRDTLQLIEESEDLAKSVEEQLMDLLETEAEEEASGEFPEDGSLTDSLGLTPEQLERCLRILARNRQRLEDADTLIAAVLGETVAEDLTPLLQLAYYEYQIQLPHESRPVDRRFDLSKLWKYLQGYSVDVTSLAPDQDLTFPEGAAVWKEQVAYSPLEMSFSLNLEDIKAHFLTEEYALGMFVNFRDQILQQEEGQIPRNLRGRPMAGRYLLNETEYLVVGSSNEYTNVNGTKNRIIALRTLLNMAYLLADPAKRQEIEELAGMTGGILLPGLGNAVAFGLILTGWSAAEAIGDYRALTDGKRIPLLKDENSFRTDLSGLLSGRGAEDTPFDEETGEGLSYRQYLRILLLMTRQEALLGRIQILLQLNEPLLPLTEAVVTFKVWGSAESFDSLISFWTFSGIYGYE